MPRLSLIGSASAGALGFGVNNRPAYILTHYLLVGGGGLDGGGAAYGGGGGGQVLYISNVLPTNSTFVASVGGVAASTTFNGATAYPGGNGGAGGIPGGGSGGTSGGGVGGGGGAGWGWDADTWTGAGGGGGSDAQSGGGGDVSTGTYPATPTGGKGGNAVYWPINGQYYGAGGGGWWIGPIAGNHNGNSGDNWGGYGSGSNRGDAVRGGVIVAYDWPLQLWTGGSVTYTGSGMSRRWFHDLTGALTPRYY